MENPRTLELKPEDLPVRLQFRGPDGLKEYVLIKTKQGKLLLNKRIDETRTENR
jgi:hypothetical protein